MATLITTITIGNILKQTGTGVPNHIAPKGSEFTDISTGLLYINKDGIIDWQVNIDNTNQSGSTGSFSAFTTFSSTTIGQTFVKPNNDTDTLSFSGINLNVLTNNTSKIITFSASTGSGGGSGDNFYVTGGTVSGTDLILGRNGGLSDITIDTSTYFDNTDRFVTGATMNGNILELSRSGGLSDVTVDLSQFIDDTNYYVTGFTYNDANVFTLSRNGGLSDLSVTADTMSNLTITDTLVSERFTNLNAVTASTISQLDYIDFNTTYTPTQQEGRLHWDADFGTLDIDLEGNTTHLKVGLDNLYYIKNQSGTTIEKGKVVRAAGTLGVSGRILGEYMIADGTIPFYYTLGIASENIPDGEDGYVHEFGLLKGVNTTGSLYSETWTGGTILYVHPTIPGGLTSVEPTEPNLKIQMAIVINAASNGSMFIRPDLSRNLNDLHNVQTSGETDGDLISYNSSQGYWDYTKSLRGDYTVDGSLSASTISAGTINATSYNNLPIDPNYYVTGGTYSDGVYTFNRNDGNSFNFEGGSNYSAGVIEGSTGWTSTGTGQINLPQVKVALYDNPNNIEPLRVYTVSSGTTGSGGISGLTNNDTNYIYIDYNGGSPNYSVSTDYSVINDSSTVIVYTIYRLNNFIHVLEFGDFGAGLANKLNDRIILTERFKRESGISLGLSGSTGVVTLTEGVTWNASNRLSIEALNSQDDIFFKNYHVGGVWSYTTTGDTINNTFYDDGTDLVTATGGKYLVNWYYRGQEVNDHLYEVYGTSQYDSVADAELSEEPALPELVTSHAFLTGRIIVEVGQNTGYTQSAFVTTFQSTNIQNHNDLTGLQGGSAGEYYHLTSTEYTNNAYSNVNNNFSTDQTINGSLTVNTISASTYNNLPIDPNYFVTGGTVSGTDLLLNRNDGNTVTIDTSSYFVDNYVTGGTLNNNSIEINRNDTSNVFTISGSSTILITESTSGIFSIETAGGSGEANTASNLGGGTGVFAQKSGIDLQFKSLTSTGGTVTITSNSTTINIESAGGGTGVSDANKIFSWYMNVT